MAHWRENNRWRSQRVLADITGSLAVGAYDSRHSDAVWITANDFLAPTTKYLGSLAPLWTGPPRPTRRSNCAPERFSAEGLAVVHASPPATTAPGSPTS